jgi:hypothetical protein
VAKYGRAFSGHGGPRARAHWRNAEKMVPNARSDEMTLRNKVAVVSGGIGAQRPGPCPTGRWRRRKQPRRGPGRGARHRVRRARAPTQWSAPAAQGGRTQNGWPAHPPNVQGSANPSCSPGRQPKPLRPRRRLPDGFRNGIVRPHYPRNRTPGPAGVASALGQEPPPALQKRS